MTQEGTSRRDFLRYAGTGVVLVGSGGLGAFLEACGATPPVAPAGPTAFDTTKLYADAQKEGKLVWYTAQFELSQAQKIVEAFKKKFPGIEVDLTRQTSQVIAQRFTQDFKNNANTVDVVGTADEGNFVEFKKMDSLVAYTPPDIAFLPKEFQNLDKDSTYFTSALALIVISYNTTLVTTPPKVWKDMLDSKWAGKITLGHPGYSGQVLNWVLAVSNKYTWSYFQDMAKLNPKIGKSINDTLTDEASGERQIGASAHSVTLGRKADGKPVDAVFPSDFTVLVVQPQGVAKKAPHPNAARLFQNFNFSKEMSQTMAETFQAPIRTDVPGPGGLSLDKIKTVRVGVDQLTSGLAEAKAKWREIMGV
jgi:iron(III) transport system substrate-binding protein